MNIFIVQTMSKTASIGMKAPDLLVSKWVQGEETNVSNLEGKVVLLEFFQVNCPGCFTYALPEAVDMYNKYTKNGII